MNAEGRKAAFMADFKALLRKHDADFYVQLRTVGWDNDAAAEVYINAKYEDGKTVDEHVSFDLPLWENGKD